MENIKDDEYFDVVCIKEFPDFPMYTAGSTYFAKTSNSGIWVGIPSISGNKFGPSTFDKHFKKINNDH